MATNSRVWISTLQSILLCLFLCLASISQRTVWHDMIGRQCHVFGVNREVLVPLTKPTGYTGADPYK
ncbi:hypothetical protein MKW94_005473, partial [Papaver nudicaule]|nr:hypothetical protein [Papaver nudicaule]